MLAKTDFRLRYQNSFLGYIWAILKPLFLFAILNFVFSSIFNPRNIGGEYYSLGLLVSLLLFTFFQEGTNAGMQSLKMKSDLVLKIYVPRWCIIMASTIHSAMVFITNFFVIAFFFACYRFFPSWTSIFLFLVFSLMMYILILSISLLFAPIFVKFRDVGMIWEVMLSAMFYATPVIYPLQILPEWIQRALLLNPVAFIVHFTKESMFHHHYAELWKFGLFFAANILLFFFTIWAYHLLIPKVAESM
jgi:ABC-type polysaccharide/polyol phosphate export permease